MKQSQLITFPDMHASFNHPATTLVLRIAAAGLSFAFSILAARLLGIETFGVVSVLLGFVNVGVVFALLGHETLATREVAILRRNVGPNAVRDYMRSASRQIWFAGAGALLVLALIIILLPVAKHAGPVLSLLLLLVPLIARTRLSQGAIRGAHLAGLALVPDGILRTGLSVLLLCALMLSGLQADRGFVMVMIFCASVALLMGRMWERGVFVKHQPSPGLVEEQTKTRHFSLHIFLSSILAVLVSQAALIAAGLLATPAEAGMYAAAERISLASALIGQAVYLSVASRFAALHASGEIAALRVLIRKVTRSVSIVTFLVCGTLSFAAAPLLGLYGSTFSVATPILQVLLLSVLFNASAGPTGHVLLMTRNESDHLRSMAVSLFIQTILIASLVPTYGVLGAAWSVFISTLVWNGLMMYFVQRRLALNPLLAFA